MIEINRVNRTFGQNAANLFDQTSNTDITGAFAAIETFYYAFNQGDLETISKIWLNHELIQLNNPLGGILRGITSISEMYNRIFHGQARVWVELTDIILYFSAETAIFAGREIGQFTVNGESLDLQIRTTRFFGYSKTVGRWLQIHHHGSIDDAELLHDYQQAVKK